MERQQLPIKMTQFVLFEWNFGIGRRQETPNPYEIYDIEFEKSCVCRSHCDVACIKLSNQNICYYSKMM